MRKEKVIRHVAETYGILPDRPFADDQDILVFRHANTRKWFGVIMTIPKNKLGIHSNEMIGILNLKCAMEIMHTIRQENGIYPAYHMNKDHWISVALDGSADDETIKWLIQISFQLTDKKKKTGIR